MMSRNSTGKLLRPDIRDNSRTQVKILCFHRVVLDGKQDGVWTLGIRDFQDQIRRFAESGFHAISLTDLYNWQTGSKALPARPLVITFDDGHEGFSELAAPVLAKYKFQATIFVVAGKLGQEVSLLGGPPFRIMSTAEVSVLTELGFEIQSHGLNHSDWTLISRNELVHELTESAEIISDITGRPVHFSAYPYGAWSPAVREAVRDAGYLGACTTAPGRNRFHQDRYLWRRDLVLSRRGNFLEWARHKAFCLGYNIRSAGIGR